MRYLTIFLLIFLVISCTSKKYLHITSEPPGANIEVNGMSVGYTPGLLVMGLNPSGTPSSTVITAIPTEATMRYSERQYTQTKIIWGNSLINWAHDTIEIHFDMRLQPSSSRYEVELK